MNFLFFKQLHHRPAWLSIAFFFLLATLLAPSSQALAVPIFKDSAKRTISSKKQTVTLSNHSAIPVLGKYRNISQHKKNIGSKQVASKKTGNIRKKISAKSAIIIDAQNGRTLFSRSPDLPRQPASTIKVLTGAIALKSLSANDQVPVSNKAARQPRSKIYLDQRKQYKADDLINAVLMASANDASVALAEKIAGSEKSFAKMMTLRAELWGAKNTVCKTASGLTAKGQTSTARDLAAIFRHAMQDKEFSHRMGKTKTLTTDGNMLRSHNKALWQVEGTEGGKTGYTNAARQTYVGKFKRGNDEIIVAIMGSETMWSDIKHLVEYGFERKIALNKQSQQLLAKVDSDSLSR
ncbi:D-alanyl-D-alanine carboxypeptidase [Methanococcoides sp. SA1]|uniref:D-alanyl-D-alanine carboxypeptidase n=1 Tax=Candidatus Desulfatifera sulfidica TaxID=2841691 RepID=A0A8J6TDM5_9BACT|nr:D-alanyl-D-alanine carboxypeptidase [Candidatus Desulfatifera sulfidica]NPE28517.1 D-alanyl-D-alanine carboxypeptidase [Methanococcoides sp. SA1]